MSDLDAQKHALFRNNSSVSGRVSVIIVQSSNGSVLLILFIRLDQHMRVLFRCSNKAVYTSQGDVWHYCVISFHPVPCLETMAQEASVQAVLEALQVFSGQPEKASIDAANRWLQDFQHTASRFIVILWRRVSDAHLSSLKHGRRAITCLWRQIPQLLPRHLQLRQFGPKYDCINLSTQLWLTDLPFYPGDI